MKTGTHLAPGGRFCTMAQPASDPHLMVAVIVLPMSFDCNPHTVSSGICKGVEHIPSWRNLRMYQQQYVGSSWQSGNPSCQHQPCGLTYPLFSSTFLPPILCSHSDFHPRMRWDVLPYTLSTTLTRSHDSAFHLHHRHLIIPSILAGSWRNIFRPGH